MQPPGAGRSLGNASVAYPIVVALFDGDWYALLCCCCCCCGFFFLVFRFRLHFFSCLVAHSIFSFPRWDASQIYRAWALPNALWTQRGPLRQRTDTPAWLFNTTTWVNSHWQQNDIFNTTGGDPIVVRNRVTDIARRFNLSQVSGAGLGLHW
jgi:hypothetical protein